MTPSLRTIAVLSSCFLLLSCSTPKLEKISGLPEAGKVHSETQSEVTDKEDVSATGTPADSEESKTPLKQTPLLPLAPPPSEPVPPPEDVNNGSNGDLNGHDDGNGKGFVRSQSGPSERLREAPPKVEVTEPGIKVPELPPLEASERQPVEATIINPYRTANIGTEVSGMIDGFAFQEGDLVQEGQVVCEVSKARYVLLAEKAADETKGLRLAVKRTEATLKIQREMFAQDASTRQDVLKAETEYEMSKIALEKAVKEQEFAELNLESCQVKAPFKGYIAVKYKQDFEPVDRMEKIFAIVDTEKVYAVANMPEDELQFVRKGDTASFVESQGIKYRGTFERMGALIDPKSRTKRVWVLIDNANGLLTAGMVGALQIERPEDK